MMTGRRTCDKVTFGMDPSKRLTTSDHSQLSQAQLYQSSERTPPRLATSRPPSARGPASGPLVLGERPGRAPSPQPPLPRSSPATSLPPQRQQRSRGDRPVTAGGEARQPGTGTGIGFPAGTGACPAARLTPTPAPPPRSSEESPGDAALSLQGVQPARGQALVATECPRLPVPASPRSSSPGPDGSKGRGPGWSLQPRVAPRCALLRGASAAGGWLLCLCHRPRATRSVPGGGARRHSGFLRCCPSRSPSSSLDPPGLSTRCPFGPPSLRGPRGSEVHGAKCAPTCAVESFVQSSCLGLQTLAQIWCVWPLWVRR